MLGRSAQADVGSQAHTCAASDRRPRLVRLCGNVLFKGAHRSLHRSVREDGTGRSLMQAELRAYAEPHRSRDSRTGILAFARTTSRRSADVLALDGAGHLVPEAVTDELATAILELGNR
jgi:hypothetical protein